LNDSVHNEVYKSRIYRYQGSTDHVNVNLYPPLLRELHLENEHEVTQQIVTVDGHKGILILPKRQDGQRTIVN
jgi:hypothetical protein